MNIFLKKIFFQKALKSLTLLELIISILILSFISLALVQILIFASISIADNVFISKSREEIDIAISSMFRDFRNAEILLNCEGDQCSYLSASKVYSWGLCDTYHICKILDGQILYKSSNNIKFNNIDFVILNYGNNLYQIQCTIFYSVLKSIRQESEIDLVQQFTVENKSYRII